MGTIFLLPVHLKSEILPFLTDCVYDLNRTAGQISLQIHVFITANIRIGLFGHKIKFFVHVLQQFYIINANLSI